MNYSTINHVIYSIRLPKEEFVIGGVFAAGLSEPKIAKLLGNDTESVDLFVSDTNFNIAKEYKDTFQRAVVTSTDELVTIRVNGLTINFHLGIPEYWITEDRLLVCNPLPLKQWLKNRELSYYADMLNEVPYEIRAREVVLTETEEDFKKRCQGFDWHYAYSDSNTVYNKGKKGLQDLIKLRDKIGGNALAIYEEYSNK